MSTPITIMDRLTEEATTSETREHVLEQAHYAVDNVEQRFLGKFEDLVAEIMNDWGRPEFNASTVSTDENRNPMPSWVTGSGVTAEGARKILRMSYWKRPGAINYVLLRMELDSKDRPKYYDLVLGARKRTRTETPKVDKLRKTDASFFGWILRLCGIGR